MLYVDLIFSHYNIATIFFGKETYNILEDSGAVEITVVRSGYLAKVATIGKSPLSISSQVWQLIFTWLQYNLVFNT